MNVLTTARARRLTAAVSALPSLPCWPPAGEDGGGGGEGVRTVFTGNFIANFTPFAPDPLQAE